MEERMKQLLAFVMASVMVLSLAACGGSSSAPASAPKAEAAAPAQVDNSLYEKENWWNECEWNDTFNLTFASTGQPGSGASVGTDRAIELLKDRSNGHINIEVVYNGALGNEFSCFSQCMEGSIEMTGCSVGTISTYVPHMEVFTLPFLINSYEQELDVLRSDEWKALLAQTNAELEGVTILAVTDFGMRHFASINKPIRTMSDIKGMNIRTAGNPVIDRALQLVGANPINVAYNDVYTALQNGLVDGEEINTTSVSSQKHYEVVKYVSHVGFYPYLTFACISDTVLDQMPEHYVKLILQCFEEGDIDYYMSGPVFEWDEKCTQDCKDHGVEFLTIEDKEEWVKAMQPIYDDKAAENPLYTDLINKALSLQK